MFLDFEDFGFCEVVRVYEYYLVYKLEKVIWMEVVGSIWDGVCVYIVLYYFFYVFFGKLVLIMDGVSVFGIIVI